MNTLDIIKAQVAESIQVKQGLLSNEAVMAKVAVVADVLVKAYQAGHKTLWAGNGGITAVGNDYGFDRLFARQVEAQGCPGDVFIGISTSGRSKNIVEALKACRGKGITSVAIVGADPCPLDEADHVIHVPSTVTPRIQECQTLIGHILCYLVEQSLFA